MSLSPTHVRHVVLRKGWRCTEHCSSYSVLSQSVASPGVLGRVAHTQMSLVVRARTGQGGASWLQRGGEVEAGIPSSLLWSSRDNAKAGTCDLVGVSVS